jgi:RNA polymerase sigma-70 factor (ECF subfamily)
MASESSHAAGEAGSFAIQIDAAGLGSAVELRHLLEGCRQYLLMVANHAMTPELRAKVAASDIVQETFLEAHQHFGKFRGSSRPELLAWLRRILECRMANTRRSFLATEKRAIAREVPLAGEGRFKGGNSGALESHSQSPSSHAIRKEWAQALEEALGRLPDHYRQVVVWRHQEQAGFEEIGRRLGCSTEAARKVWNRAIHQLRQELEPMG